MESHHTKDKGDLGVLKAQIDLFEQGFTILCRRPNIVRSTWWLTRMVNFGRVQVKYRVDGSSGKLTSSSRHVGPTGRDAYCADRQGEVDLYCVYCPDTDECYYLEPGKFGSNVSLRVKAPKNSQKQTCNFAADYRRVP